MRRQVTADVGISLGGVQVIDSVNADVTKDIDIDARDRIIAWRMATVNGRVGGLSEPFEIVGDLGHAKRQRVQHIVGRCSRTRFLEIGERLCRVVGDADVAS